MADVEAEIRSRSRAWQRAIVANDADEIAGFASDDWVLVDETGIGTRERFLALVASGDLTHSEMRTVDGTERIRIYGDTAVVTARVFNTAHFGGQEFRADEWTTDVFRRVEGTWVCVLSHVTPARGLPR